MSKSKWTSGSSRVLKLSCLLSCLLFLPGIQWISAGEAGDGEKRYPLRVGFTRSMFADTNPNDAKAAVKVWADSIANLNNLQVTSESRVYEKLSDLQQALEDSKVEIAALRTDEYFDLSLSNIPEDLFVGSRLGSPIDHPILLTQPSASSLSVLQNKRFNILADSSLGMSLAWLNTLLLEKGFPEIHQYSSDIKEVRKISQAVLPVFFNQRDACLVTQKGFEAMVELNPQIGKRLKVLQTGPGILPGLTFIHPDLDPSFRKRLAKALEELHLNTRGEQVLMIFKTDRLIRCDDRYLKQAKDLIDRYQILRRGALQQARN